jgi:Ni2+-binding GTPase involved in maturation of urease and hydrogenase
MKVIICAGPPTTGKTTVLRQVAKRLLNAGLHIAYFKIDVQYATEDEIFKKEFGIPAKKVYSGELCPDHCNVVVLRDAIEWAQKEGSDFLLVETAGLCLRCSPYIKSALGVVVLEATSGMNLPRKIGPMLTLANIAVVTKIDLISQAEREVFRAQIMNAAPNTAICETNALYGIGIDSLVKKMQASVEISYPLVLLGSPPVGTCTICVGKKEIGWQEHFGVVRPLESDIFYRGE